MAAYDSDNDMFITQNTFAGSTSSDIAINSDFEDLINADGFDVSPDFDMGSCGLLDMQFSDSDKQLNDTIDEIEKCISDVDKSVLDPNVCAEESKSRDHRENDLADFKTRFGTPLSDAEVQKLCESGYACNTENKSRWALRLYQAWVQERQLKANKGGILLNPAIVALAEEEYDLNKTLMSFFAEVRNQKGEEYGGNTLYEIATALQYYIRRNGRHVNFYEFPYFAGLRYVLDARMKLLARQGIGIEKRKAEVISVEQEELLWKNGFLGEDTPQKVLDTILYLIGLNCALRAGDEHRFLRTGPNSQFKITVSSAGVKQLKNTEDVSKTNRGRLKHRRLNRKTVRVMENAEMPQRCLVRLYEKYMSLRPKNGKCTAFYPRPLRYPKDEIWYADVAIGIHPLRSTVGRICSAAGFTGFFSNHSLRATTATRLYDSGVDEQLIAERTGHKSTALREYKRTSEKQEDHVDDIIQRKKRNTSTLCQASSTVTSTVVQPAATAAAAPATTSTSDSVIRSRECDLTLVLKDGVTLSLTF